MRNQVISRDQQKIACFQGQYLDSLPLKEHYYLDSVVKKYQVKLKTNNYMSNENSSTQKQEQKGTNLENKKQSSSRLSQNYKKQAFKIKSKDDILFLVLFVLAFFVAIILAPNQFCNSKN